jgi:hypothetical protein
VKRFPALRGLRIGTILLALAAAIACTPPDGLQSADGTTQAGQQSVPFHDTDGKQPSPGDSSAARNAETRDQEKSGSKKADLPFQSPLNLPAGTLLTVRTKNTLSVGKQDANGTFEAIVDQPVVIDGSQLVTLGAMVSGRVESARASSLKRNRGYVRLTLESIQLAGTNLPIQTSSLFVRGKTGPTQTAENRVVRLEKGRRLVFRLTEPVYIATGERPPASR